MATIEGSKWYYEVLQCRLASTSMVLVRIVIGMVENWHRLVEILRNTPIRQGLPGWNCVAWVKEALETLEVDKEALGTSVARDYGMSDGGREDFISQKRLWRICSISSS